MTGGRTSVLRGAALTVTMRWTDRLIGVVSTLVLARLLVPEDIGIVAMSSLVVALADALLDLGVHVPLIQNRETTREHFDTAWTIKLLQLSVSALLVVIASPFAVSYFDEPRVGPVLQISAIGLLLAGFENIGIVSFQKEMRFGKDFQFVFLKRIVGFTVTMVAALMLRNYWALVFGSLAGQALGVVLSYAMHPFRPKFSMVRGREVFGFSQWMLVRGLGNYFDGRLHRIVVGGRDGAAVMGGYSIGGDISAMPSTELLMPMNRVLFPRFVQAKDDATELKRVFLVAQGVQTMLAVPASIGLALVANDAVPVLLGEKWMLAVPFVQLFALANVVQALTTSAHYVMLSLGQPARVAALSWLQVFFFAVLVYAVLPHGNAEQVAAARVATVFLGLGVSLWLLRGALPNVSWSDLARSATRPLVAAATMGVAILGMDAAVTMSHLAALVAKVSLGALVYCAVLWLLWRASSRPEGAESYLLRSIGSVIRPRMAAWRAAREQ